MRHSLQRHLLYQPRQLFDLVGDVERYPEFLPWVIRLRTWNRRSDDAGLRWLDAEAEVRFSVVRERFSTRVRFDEPALAIEISLLSGPFRRLASRWRFVAEGEGARLEFEIDFEFKSRLLDRVLAANFHRAADRLVGCFEARARALYG